jgi:hypothetical protein
MEAMTMTHSDVWTLTLNLLPWTPAYALFRAAAGSCPAGDQAAFDAEIDRCAAELRALECARDAGFVQATQGPATGARALASAELTAGAINALNAVEL